MGAKMDTHVGHLLEAPNAATNPKLSASVTCPRMRLAARELVLSPRRCSGSGRVCLRPRALAAAEPPRPQPSSHCAHCRRRAVLAARPLPPCHAPPRPRPARPRLAAARLRAPASPRTPASPRARARPLAAPARPLTTARRPLAAPARARPRLPPRARTRPHLPPRALAPSPCPARARLTADRPRLQPRARSRHRLPQRSLPRAPNPACLPAAPRPAWCSPARPPATRAAPARSQLSRAHAPPRAALAHGCSTAVRTGMGRSRRVSKRWRERGW
nr:DBF4-type zinc finger-containing protein 2 homolog [Aegilops tauschii subsp. strangulata]